MDVKVSHRDIIAKPEWVVEDTDEDDAYSTWSGPLVGDAGRLSDLRHEDCSCCAFCQGFICNPNFIEAGKPCIGTGCQ